MNSNIYITGFMGSGKSTIGRSLAKILGRRFVDMDAAISKKSDMSITSYFEHLGEERFREAETALLSKIAKEERLIVATGGGVPVRTVNRTIMRDSGKIVHLHVPLDDCIERLGQESDSQRPLWKNKSSVSALYESRCQAYEDYDLQIEPSDKIMDELAWEICERFNPDESLDVHLGSVIHPLVFTWRGPDTLKKLTHSRKTFLVTDNRVSKFHLDRYRAALGDASIMILPAGERSKTLTVAKRLYESMLNGRIGRDGLLIAIGGGVITDLGAFVASTYKRGIPFVLVSTSLVGCVDAAIGGKAAVDLNNVKNPVGCFAAPEAVILDLRALSTLPASCVSEGLVEAYKTGLVANPELASLIETNMNPLLRCDLLLLQQVVLLSATAKAEIVGKDFREKGLRQILNFGHTFGHAVESFNNYRISHGTAVAVGMMLATALSENLGLIASEEASEIQSTIRNLVRGPVRMPASDDAWEIMMNDKKNRDGRVNFVLLAGIGSPVFVDDVQPKELNRAISSIEGLPNE